MKELIGSNGQLTIPHSDKYIKKPNSTMYIASICWTSLIQQKLYLVKFISMWRITTTLNIWEYAKVCVNLQTDVR